MENIFEEEDKLYLKTEVTEEKLLELIAVEEEVKNVADEKIEYYNKFLPKEEEEVLSEEELEKKLEEEKTNNPY